jgi:hypothetical protein
MIINEDIIHALKRISMVAHYSLEQRDSLYEMRKTLTYIIEEVTEAISKAQGTAS